ncbi:MAG: hypothetical protein M3P26_12110, partial [Gemmatimonadota bacterium]|nr:hypothetical protein [Gemmatimonadota bacterium]
ALEQRDLTLVIGVVLQKATDHGSDGEAGPERGIALVADPAQEIVGLERVDGALEVLLRRGEIILRRLPSWCAPLPSFTGGSLFAARLACGPLATHRADDLSKKLNSTR